MAAQSVRSVEVRAAPVIEVHAEDGYLIDQEGQRLDSHHRGRRLRVMNVEEVRGLNLELTAVDVIYVGGREQQVLQLVEPASKVGEIGINVCKPRDDGSAWLIPISGRWTRDGVLDRRASGATLACASGALGKCVEWGFAPWTDVDLFTACTRMVRADYCGDGQAHTQPGIRITFERLQDSTTKLSAPKGFRFEALWSAKGAHCISATRVPVLFSMDDVLQQCPERAANINAVSTCDGENNPSESKAMFTNYFVEPDS
jgi:hypothetical protein